MLNVSTTDSLALVFPLICQFCPVTVLPLLLALLLCLVSVDLHELGLYQSDFKEFTCWFFHSLWGFLHGKMIRLLYTTIVLLCYCNPGSPQQNGKYIRNVVNYKQLIIFVCTILKANVWEKLFSELIFFYIFYLKLCIIMRWISYMFENLNGIDTVAFFIYRTKEIISYFCLVTLVVRFYWCVS